PLPYPFSITPTAPTGLSTLSLHDALPISEVNAKAVDVAGSDHELVRLKGKAEFRSLGKRYGKDTPRAAALVSQLTAEQLGALEQDRKSTRLNSSHVSISYAVFCLKKKKKT